MKSTKSKTIKQKITIFFMSIFLLLAAANIAASATLSSKGEQLRSLEVRARELRHQNQILETKLINNRSLTYLDQKAGEMGFVEKPELVIVAGDVVVAQASDTDR